MSNAPFWLLSLTGILHSPRVSTHSPPSPPHTHDMRPNHMIIIVVWSDTRLFTPPFIHAFMVLLVMYVILSAPDHTPSPRAESIDPLPCPPRIGSPHV